MKGAIDTVAEEKDSVTVLDFNAALCCVENIVHLKAVGDRCVTGLIRSRSEGATQNRPFSAVAPHDSVPFEKTCFM